MQDHDDLHMAYRSELAPGLDYTAFAAICRTARRHNAQQGIAGVLMFDGLRFFQWLHGPAEAVAGLMQRIAADPRHVTLQMLLAQPLPWSGGRPLWRSGYADTEAMDELMGLHGMPAAPLLAVVQRLSDAADLEPMMVARLR